MAIINNIQAREILDSRGNPTIEVEVTLENQCFGIASVPSGASTGKLEAIEKRDNDPSRYCGKGVLKAIHIIKNKIKPKIVGINSLKQRYIDKMLINLDGTQNKENFGANTILGVSLAIAHASSKSLNIPFYNYLGGLNSYILPVPFINILNGGVHADSGTDIQEFMIAPVGAKTFSEALRWGSEVYHSLKDILKFKNMKTSLGDEGGYSPTLNSNNEALDLILLAIEKAKLTPGKDIYLAVDVASSEFFHNGKYVYEDKKCTSQEMCKYYLNLINNYPLISIEDPLSENDWQGWIELTKTIGNKVQLVGDDLFVTNTILVDKGIKLKAANAVLIKPNQIGTLTETLDAILIAKNAKYKTMISHRSGETEDTTIADIAVAMHAMQIKTGAPARSERTAKYNRLLRIEKYLGQEAMYAGSRILDNTF